jgi:hypothetical protein
LENDQLCFEGGQVETFFQEFKGGKKSILTVSNGRYIFRGEKSQEPVELIGIPDKNIIFYVSMKGRIAVTGSTELISDWGFSGNESLCVFHDCRSPSQRVYCPIHLPEALPFALYAHFGWDTPEEETKKIPLFDLFSDLVFENWNDWILDTSSVVAGEYDHRSHGFSDDDTEDEDSFRWAPEWYPGDDERRVVTRLMAEKLLTFDVGDLIEK